MKILLIIISLFAFSCVAYTTDMTTTHTLKECGATTKDCSCEHLSPGELFGSVDYESDKCYSGQEVTTTCPGMSCSNKPSWAKICYCE